MNWIKMFELFNSSEEVKDLVEDVFQEVFDKWRIQKIPSDRVAGDFMTEVDDDKLYYHIEDSSRGIMFRIYQNRFPDTSESFSELSIDCVKLLYRLKKFDLGYDVSFDNRLIQNPYNFSALHLFILKLNKKGSE